MVECDKSSEKKWPTDMWNLTLIASVGKIKVVKISNTSISRKSWYFLIAKADIIGQKTEVLTKMCVWKHWVPLIRKWF